MSMHGRRLCGKRMISRLRIDPIPLLTRSLLKLSQQGSLSQWDGAMEGRSQGMIGRLIISFLKCFVIDLHELIIELLIALGWHHRKNSFAGGTADDGPVLLIIIASSSATTGRSSPRFGMDWPYETPPGGEKRVNYYPLMLPNNPQEQQNYV
jgi:hypothetical protein